MRRSEKNIIVLPSLETIEAEAAAWLTALESKRIQPEDLARFKAWVGQSKRHRRAFDALSSLWGDLAILKELEDIATEDIATAKESMAPMRAAWTKGISRRRVVAFAACIPIAAAVGIGIEVYRHRWSNDKNEFVTRVGEQKTVRLADHSIVQLNTNSLVRVEYSEAFRNVRLLRGEAYFDVVKNPKRPFSVYAANGIVRAVGTAFTVRLRRGMAVEVTVEEGRVALASAGSDGLPKAIAELTTRQNAIFARHIEHLVRISATELAEKLAWRQGILVYTDVPLSKVIADVSRYTKVKIEVSDPTLRSKKVGGVFRIGKLDALFDALRLTFGLKVEHVTPNLVLISRKA